MSTYKQAFNALIEKFRNDNLIKYRFYDFANKDFNENAQSRICHLSITNECDYNKDALLMIFTIGKNMSRIVIQSEGERTTNPSSTYPQKLEALRLAKDNKWKYIAVAISSDDFEDETIRNYVVSIESTTYGKATVCVIDECIDYLKKHNLPDFYRCKQKAGDIEYSLSFIKKDKLIDYIKIFDNRAEVESSIIDTPRQNYDYSTTKGIGINKIFYGVPGCGKSYHIEHNILGKDKETKKYKGEYEEENIIRTTFYQDYSNSDFVGQILPKITKDDNGKDIVEYIINPGPFTLALIQAIKNPNQNVALVVEEINRGNAPAIFGDIFQLLDRDDNGVSEYGIVNVGVIDYLEQVNFGTEEAPVYYTFNDIKIPGNMSIYATMNTSDQNVYTLDTAFTRRWAKERIANDFGDNDIKDMYVPGIIDCEWKTFVDAINNHIQNKLDDLQVNEDKQLGAFFVKKSDLLKPSVAWSADNLTEEQKKEKLDKANAFAYKVLEYLWEDVSKLDHSVIFIPNYKTFDSLVRDYIKNGANVFCDDIKNKITKAE